MTAEQWRPITEAAGYEVSDQGRVRSYRRGAPRVLRPLVNPSGHHHVQLFPGDGQPSPLFRSVHSLVITAFVGPRPDGLEVRHLDGNPANNLLANLRYGTRSENALDMVVHGIHPSARKSHCPQGHPYSPENTYVPPSRDERQCRTCRSERDLASREKRREHQREYAKRRYWERRAAESAA